MQAKFQEVSSELYKKASAQAEPQPGPSEGSSAEAEKKDPDVVDAEFEMVDEDKKKS